MSETDIATHQRQSMAELAQALDNAQSIIERSYLGRLDKLPVVPPSSEIADIDISKCGRFYQLDRLVTNKEENFLDKLVTVANAVAPLGSSLATVISSNGKRLFYAIGVVSKSARLDNDRDNALREAGAETFSGAVKGNFSGSILREVSEDEVQTMCESLSDGTKSIAAVSGVVSLRNKDDRDTRAYVQGLENLANALHGKKYTIVMIADAVDSARIRAACMGYEKLYTQLSYFQSYTITMNESKSVTISDAQTDGITNGISDGITLTQSRSINSSHTNGSSFGASAGVGFGVPGVGAHVSASYSKQSSDTYGTTTGDSSGWSLTSSHAINSARTLTTGSGKDYGRSLQVSGEDRTVKGLLERIDICLGRLKTAENYGAFECAAYVIADSRIDALSVAGQYNALMRGDDSFVQSSHINVWSPPGRKRGSEELVPVEMITKYLRSFTHPEFLLDEKKKWTVRPSSLVSGKELAVQFAMPKKSLHGLTVLEMTPFGRNVPEAGGRRLDLGTLYYMGSEESEHAHVALNAESLSSHTFITGSTGSGKSNTIYQMLDELDRQGIRFLVIEPAKGEYKNVFGGRDDVCVWGTDPDKAPLLRLNPFAFPKGIHILEHTDRLVEIFNACWPMYAAMPAILKDAVETAYRAVGWDLRRSINKNRIFPTFSQLMKTLPDIIKNASYSNDTSSDYKGALLTRVNSLTTGIFGEIFSGEEIPGAELFDRNVIVDLSRVGSSETKALIMGVLVLKLQEYRTACAGDSDYELRHVTVLEEAHNLLRRTSMEQSQDGSNLLGKSVEMLANAISEMRTYGEGFIIADQSPGLLDLSVIRNTNTKIIMRIPDENDRRLVGKAAGLSDEQIVELARLEQGVACVFQSNWPEAALCKVRHFKAKKLYKYQRPSDEKAPFRKFVERAIDIRESLDLTEEEADSLRQWRGRLNYPDNIMKDIDTVLRDETLGELIGGWLVHEMFDGKEITRPIQSEYKKLAIHTIDMDIATRFDYDSDSPAVKGIRMALLSLVSKNTRDESIRHFVEETLPEIEKRYM